MSIYLSASSIRDFVRCPKKVLYRITKPFPIDESIEMKVGSIVHLVLEKEWKDFKKAIDLAVKICNETDGFPVTATSQVLQLVGNYFRGFRQLVGDKDLIEKSFKLPLYKDIFLVGKFDRIHQSTIIDWKTGGSFYKNLSGDIQCILYDYAYKELTGEYPEKILIVSLSKNMFTAYEKNQEYVDRLFSEVIPNMLKAMKDNSYDKLGIFNGSCYKCQYRKGCLGE